MSRAMLLLFYIVAIMDLSFSFLPVEGKKRITLETICSLFGNALLAHVSGKLIGEEYK